MLFCTMWTPLESRLSDERVADFFGHRKNEQFIKRSHFSVALLSNNIFCQIFYDKSEKVSAKNQDHVNPAFFQ